MRLLKPSTPRLISAFSALPLTLTGASFFADPGRLEADVGDVLLHLRRNRAVAGHSGRDGLLNRAEIDRLRRPSAFWIWRAPLSMFAEPERSQAMAGSISAVERKFVSSTLPVASLEWKTMRGSESMREPPIAVILLDRLVDDGGRIVGSARLLEERVERAEIGRDEIVGALAASPSRAGWRRPGRRADIWRSGLSAPPRPRAWPACRRRGRETPTAPPRPATKRARRRRDRPGRNRMEGIGRPVRFSEDNPSLRQPISDSSPPRDNFRVRRPPARLVNRASPRRQRGAASDFSAPAPWRRRP